MSAARPRPPDRTAAGRYWPDGGVDSDAFRARFPDREQLIEMARLASSGRIRFWHPWHMERTPEPERIGRKIVWSAAPNGDREWPHALARGSHLVDLAAGHVLTGSPELLRTWMSHVSQLARSRDRGLHSRWASFVRPYERELWGNRLDAALRLLNLIRSYDLVRGRPTVAPPMHGLVLDLVAEDAAWLNEGLGRRAGNWEVFIGTAVLLASVFLSGVEEASGWRARSTTRLREILDLEIGPDGVMTEQVPMYQGVCALALADVLVAFRPNGVAPPPELVAAVRSLMSTLRRLADPAGRIPQIGDSDAFEVDYLERFVAAAVDTSIPKTQASPLDVLAASGLAVARWRGGYLLFDASGRPPASHAGHSHADDLQVLVELADGPLLVDPGRFTYANGFQPHLPLVGRALTPRGRFGLLNRLLFPRFRELNGRDWRSYFRSTLAHNTVAIEGRNQPGYDADGVEPATVRLIAAEEAAGGFVLSAESAASRVHHRRFVLGAVPELLVMADHVALEAEADWIASYHLAAGVEARVAAADAVALQRGGQRRTLSFASIGAGGLDLAVVDDWVSPIYNEKHPSRTVRATVRRGRAAWLFSALTLQESSSTPTIELRPAGSEIFMSVGAADARFEARLDPAAGTVREFRRLNRS